MTARPAPDQPPRDTVPPIDSRRVAQPQALYGPIVVAVALVLALFLVPFPAASLWADVGYRSRAALVDALSSAFVHFWDAGSSDIGPDLSSPVDFWMRFHVVKAALAAVLIVALAHLGSRTWAAYAAAATLARTVVAGALATATGLVALFALLALVANLQGVMAPLSSALGLLPMRAPDPSLAETLAQVRHDLVADPTSPALEALVHDFTVYHAAMAGLAALTSAGLAATAVIVWRRRSRLTPGPRQSRRLLAAAAVAAVALSGFFVVITAANISTSLRPAPGLLGFLEGGG